MNVHIHTKDNLPTGDFDDASHFVRQYIQAIHNLTVQGAITNIQSDLCMLQVDDVLRPMSITSEYQADNSYVCSPFNHYFVYGLEELELLDNPFLVSVIRGVLAPIKALYRASAFDKAIMLNNFLLSTNLWSNISATQIQQIIHYLSQKFPDYAIIFRSVDCYSHPELYHALSDADCEMIFSRKVYYQDIKVARSKRDFKKDLKHYRKTEYDLLCHDDLQARDFPRLAQLYNMLYIERYSAMNPKFTAEYMQAMWKGGLMHFKAFRKNGRIDAFLAYYVRDGMMTQPLFGYDTKLPQDLGLYRLLNTQVTLEGEAHGYQIHNSAGVGKFKRLRGAVPINEYYGVYTQHLPTHRQMTWQLLKTLMNHVTIPMIDSYGF